uniref:Uncharacterized protein n=1 Tax=Timema bartmani TaxID=61472 RepID=A0A7R9EZ29_9NEOP|nr:unnamed protein product [Timema bartmani]
MNYGPRFSQVLDSAWNCCRPAVLLRRVNWGQGDRAATKAGNYRINTHNGPYPFFEIPIYHLLSAFLLARTGYHVAYDVRLTMKGRSRVTCGDTTLWGGWVRASQTTVDTSRLSEQDFGTSMAPSRVDDVILKPLDKRIGGTGKFVVEGLRQLPEVVLDAVMSRTSILLLTTACVVSSTYNTTNCDGQCRVDADLCVDQTRCDSPELERGFSCLPILTATDNYNCRTCSVAGETCVDTLIRCKVAPCPSQA